jgi:hypothetical protein
LFHTNRLRNDYVGVVARVETWLFEAFFARNVLPALRWTDTVTRRLEIIERGHNGPLPLEMSYLTVFNACKSV